MAYIASEGVRSPSASGLGTWLAGLRIRYDRYRRRREVYLRTMRELESYFPRELHDLGLQSADFERIAQEQAARLA